MCWVVVCFSAYEEFKCTVLNGKCSDLVSCSVVGCCGCCILWCLGGW